MFFNPQRLKFAHFTHGLQMPWLFSASLALCFTATLLILISGWSTWKVLLNISTHPAPTQCLGRKLKVIYKGLSCPLIYINLNNN